MQTFDQMQNKQTNRNKQTKQPAFFIFFSSSLNEIRFIPIPINSLVRSSNRLVQTVFERYLCVYTADRLSPSSLLCAANVATDVVRQQVCLAWCTLPVLACEKKPAVHTLFSLEKKKKSLSRSLFCRIYCLHPLFRSTLSLMWLNQDSFWPTFSFLSFLFY